MTEEEYFPLINRDGETNPHLMSYSQLYLDEIVLTIFNHYNEANIKEFLETIGSSDVEMKREGSDIEWLVYALCRHKEGFKVLYNYVKHTNPLLFDKMILKNESGLHRETINAFKKFFLTPAPDLTLNSLEDAAEFDDDEEEENVMESDDEKENKMDETTATRSSNTTIDSDDSVPEDYYKKRKELKAEGISEMIMKVEEPEIEEDDEDDEENESTLYGYKDTVLDKIAAIFDPEFAKSSLERSYAALKTITDPLNTPDSAPEMKYSPWARAILRELPKMAPDKEELPDFPSLVFNFAKTCENDPNNRIAILHLIPDYEDTLNRQKAALKGRFGKNGVSVDVVKEVIKECRPADDYAHHRKIAPNEYQTIVMPICLRLYQKELVEKANMGENTVIVAPTGSGKTVVAAQIMRHHIAQRKTLKKPYRMVMVVPKIPLVEQQQKQLYQYMNDVVHSAILHGDMMFEEQGKIEKVLCAELIVMTPQILINLLESVRAKERLFVADISLLILDECHHCCSNHPYAQLMKIIRDWEYEKPQIVGLTASLGVGKDGILNEASAHEHVVSLLARMTAISVSTVVINEKELEAHVKLPVDDIKDVRRAENNLDLPFTNKLTEFMNSITVAIRSDLQRMSKLGNDSGVLLPHSLLKTVVHYYETEKYGGRIEAIKAQIRPMTDGALKADLNMALDILKVCNMAWAMNDLLPASTVWPSMKIAMNALNTRNGDNRFVKSFYEQYYEALNTSVKGGQQEDNDMLRALRQELSDQFKKNPKSKVIIFVGTRELSSALSEYINERKDLINEDDERECAFIISSKARGEGTVSQTPVEQKAALTNFRNNKLAILVSTTVAEEGLDVPECNLIIKYNMTGNVISLTQQRGRARAKDSRSVLIVLSGSVKKRELENANAERMMNHVVRKIHQQGDAMLKKAVENKCMDMKREDDEEKARAIRKKESLQSKRFEVLCGNCNTYLCDSFQIKNDASHYFACDKDIWREVRIDFTDLKGKFIDMVTTVLGKVICNGQDGSCGYDLGKVLNYYGCYLPSLKCASLALKDKSDNKIIGTETSGSKKKAWGEVSETFFYISKINTSDVEEMMTALSMHNVELFENLETRCKEIRRKTRRDAERKYEQKKDEDEGAESD